MILVYLGYYNFCFHSFGFCPLILDFAHSFSKYGVWNETK
jgi:hypothetical protein